MDSRNNTERFFKKLSETRALISSLRNDTCRSDEAEKDLQELLKLVKKQEAFIDRLHDPYREILRMHYEQGLTLRIVASRLSANYNDIMKIYKKASEMLEAEIRDWEEAE